MPGERLWQTYIEVRAGNVSAKAKGDDQDLDIEVEVGFSENSDGLGFTATLWNLSKDTWSGIQKGDPCEIRVGWNQSGPTPKSICIGRINKRYTQTEQQDRKYIIEGQDQSDERLNVKFSHTWQDQPPDTIAKFIAGEIDLGVGKFDSAGSAIEGYWTAKKDKPARYWLSQLVKEAEKKTGEKWKFYAKAGKLYFLKQKSNVEQAIDINKYNAIKVDTAQGNTSKSSDENEIEFEAYIDPRLTKDSLLNVNSTDASGIYRVSKYDYTSSTVNGDHLMSGTAVDVSADYKLTFPGTQRGYVRAYRQTP